MGFPRVSQLNTVLASPHGVGRTILNERRRWIHESQYTSELS